MNAKLLKACKKKFSTISQRGESSTCNLCCCKWPLWKSPYKKDKIVPSDVPKGHLVVYVGESHKRFVIKVTLLKHPLFQALLERSREVYGFTADTRLCIPCDEGMFLSVVRCARSAPDRRLFIYLRERFHLQRNLLQCDISC